MKTTIRRQVKDRPIQKNTTLSTPCNENNEYKNIQNVPILFLKQSAQKPILDFGRVRVGYYSSVVLRVANETRRDKDLQIEKLPTEEGFSVQDVSFRIPAYSTKNVIPILWYPRKEGRVRTSISFRCDNKIKLQVILQGEATNDETALGFEKKAMLTRAEVIETQSMQLHRGKKRKDSPVTHLKSAKKIKRAPLIDLNTNSKRKINQSVQTPKIMKRKKQISGLNIADLRKERLQWMQSLPVKEIDLEQEIERIEKNYPNKLKEQERRKSFEGLKQVTALYFNSDKIQLLLKWVQAVCATYGVVCENFTDAFTSRDGKDERKFKLLVNFYQPKPKSLEELFPEDFKTKKEEPICKPKEESTSDHGWVGTFSPTKYPNLEEEPEIVDEKKIITKVAHLCAKCLNFRAKWIAHQRQKEAALAAVLKIQSIFRMWKHRRYFLYIRSGVLKATLLLQSLIRRKNVQKKYRQQQEAATSLQSLFRCVKERRSFLEKRKVTVLLQAHVRGRNMRELIRQQREAITLIQSYERMRQARNHFSQTKKAACTLKYLMQGYVQRKKFIELKNATIIIQACIKRNVQRERFLQIRESTIVLQSICRMHKARKEFLQFKNAAHIIGSLVYTKMCRDDFLQLRNAAIQLQRTARGIQERRRLANMQLAAIQLQSFIRMQISMKRFEQLKNNVIPACITIQSMMRMKKLRTRFLEMKKATLNLQSIVRARREQKKLQQLSKATILLQSIVRMHIAKSRFEIQKKIARGMEEIINTFRTRNQFLAKRKSAITVQSLYKAKKQQAEFKRTKKSCIVVQSLTRMRNTRKTFIAKKSAATTIAASYRGKRQRDEFITKKRAATLLQAHIRGEQVRGRLQDLKESSITLQSIIRMKKVRREFIRTKRATSIMKSALQMNNTRNKFVKMKNVAIRVQAICRGHIVRKQLQQITKSAIVLQSFVKMQIARKEFLELKNATLKIQELFKAKKEMMKCRSEFLSAKKGIVRLQAVIRGRKQRKKYLERKRREEEKKRQTKQYQAAMKIQRLWRGYFFRSRNPELVKQVQLRIQRVKELEAERRKLDLKTREAIAILLNSKKMVMLMKACANLASTTSLSQESCESLVREGAVHVIFEIIKQCNRSKPHVQLLGHALIILINLSKTAYTSKSVWDCSDCVDVLVEQLQMYRDNEEIFMKALRVLELQCNDKGRLNAIKTMSNIMKRLNSIANILGRKYKTEKKFLSMQRAARRQSMINMSLSSSMNMSFSGQAVRKSMSVITCYEALAKFLKLLQN